MHQSNSKAPALLLSQKAMSGMIEGVKRSGKDINLLNDFLNDRKTFWIDNPHAQKQHSNNFEEYIANEFAYWMYRGFYGRESIFTPSNSNF